MAYFRDFTVCDYFPSLGWRCRLMAIGWLERGKPFDRGTVPDGVIERIEALRPQFAEAMPQLRFRGLHCCSLCPGEPHHTQLSQSNINLFVPHRGFVFVAPGRVDHYIATHGYSPPESFIRCLLDCPPPTSPAYREACREANRGEDAPLFPE